MLLDVYLYFYLGVSLGVTVMTSEPIKPEISHEILVKLEAEARKKEVSSFDMVLRQWILKMDRQDKIIAELKRDNNRLRETGQKLEEQNQWLKSEACGEQVERELRHKIKILERKLVKLNEKKEKESVGSSSFY